MKSQPTHDPFREAREEASAVECFFQGKRIPMLLRHAEVKEAAKDWKTFSSDVPFRVPIPSEETVRSVRQLPIERDPPEHTEYRKIVEPFFNRPREPWMKEKLLNLIRELIGRAASKDSAEVVGEISLPLQSRALTYLLGVDESVAEVWISWGVNVLRDKELSVEKGRALEEYIRGEIARAQQSPGEDFFSVLTKAEFRGRKLTLEEMMGFSNLVFAGGRDTIIHSVSWVLAFIAENPGTLDELRANPKLSYPAVEEFMRFFSPLSHIGRVCPHAAKAGELPVEADGSISLNWASANRDTSVFECPDEIRLDRKPNPHIAFGSGPHTCLGAVHARAILRTLLQVLAEDVSRIDILEEEIHWEGISQFRRPLGYDRLIVKIQPGTRENS